MKSVAPFELVMRGDQAYVMRRSDYRLLASLTRMEAAILKMIADGESDTEIRDALHQAMFSGADSILERVEMRFSSLLRQDRGVTTTLSFEHLNSIQAPDGSVHLRELPGPRVLHWHVTRYCPRKCIYCYAEPLHGGHADDAIIARNELAAIFAEAATLGAEHLVLSGAEPLLRSDLPEVMGDAISYGITPFLTTKHPIDDEIAGRLATAGVNHVSLSLDTASPEQSLMMIGSSSYPAHVRSSITNLSKAGVEFSIQTVVTPFNCDDLSDVAKLAADYGAKVMQVVPFEPVRKPIAGYGNSAMLLPDRDAVRRGVERLARNYPSIRFELFEKLGTGGRSQFHCDIGMTKLFFLPNGVVHRCYKLVEDGTLTGRDLRSCSVAEAWHDPAFANIISPPKEIYTSSTCGKCSRFNGCHSEGRCIYEASVTHGSYYDRDRACDGPYTTRPVLVPLATLQGI